MKFFLNGATVDEERAGELLEPGFLYGWGVFETLRVYEGKLPFLEEHINRLKKGAQVLRLDAPLVNYRRELNCLLEGNGLKDASARITVFKKTASTGVMITTRPGFGYKDEDYSRGAKIIFYKYERYSREHLLRIKTTSYVQNRIALDCAGCESKQEAVFSNEKGFMQEGSRSNIFFVKSGKVFTPSIDCGVLPGITRMIVMDICAKGGIEIVEGEFNRSDLFAADEIFLTSSLMEIMPVSQVDDKPCGFGGEITRRISGAYKQRIRAMVE